MAYEVDVTYDADYYYKNYDEKICNLALKHGGDGDYGSGMGFGGRDLTFEFPTRKNAQDFIRVVERYKAVQHAELRNE